MNTTQSHKHAVRSRSAARTVILIAGPNGAGKTTFAQEFLPNEAGGMSFLNLNCLAQGLAPFAPEAAAGAARRLLARLIRDRIRRGADFAVETTFSSLAYARSIRTWRKHGYRVELVFLGLAAPELAVARVGSRARQGGHAVPEAEIRWRFAVGLLHFQRHFQNAVDAWVWFDNSGAQPALLAAGGDRRRAVLRDAARRSLLRSGAVARQLGRRTQTPVFIWRDGRPVSAGGLLPAIKRRVA
jgi:predicted ABC-type ATPase